MNEGYLIFHAVILVIGAAGFFGNTVDGLAAERRGSLIPFPRVGRSEYFMDSKRSSGLIPFPRVGRSDMEMGELAMHEDKRQGLIPFPRVGKRQSLIPFPRVGKSSMTPYFYRRPLAYYVSDGNTDDDMLELDFPAGEISKRGGGNGGGMWFGPRLGRRDRRSIDTVVAGEGKKEESMTLAELLKNTPWALIALKAGHSDEKRHTPNFTPRLGRESGEEDSQTFEDRSTPYTPRLGRQQDMDEEERRSSFEDYDREDRSTVFSPRLGRSVEPPSHNDATKQQNSSKTQAKSH